MAFPAYVIAYRYRGRLYRTVISGQDAGCIIGNAPRSVAKVILVIALALLVLGGLAVGLLLVEFMPNPNRVTPPPAAGFSLVAADCKIL